MTKQKAQRNDPCPCGSGKKYKKCCWNKEKRKEFSAKVISDITSGKPGKTNRIVQNLTDMMMKIKSMDKSVDDIEKENEAFANVKLHDENATESLKDKILRKRKPQSEDNATNDTEKSL